MLVNGSITHYHKGYDKINKVTTWTRYNYDNVHIIGGKGSSTNKGYAEANDVEIRIWYQLNNADFSNFAIGDIIVDSHITTNITTKTDIKTGNIYEIKSLKNNNFVNLSKHIHISGK